MELILTEYSKLKARKRDENGFIKWAWKLSGNAAGRGFEPTIKQNCQQVVIANTVTSDPQ